MEELVRIKGCLTEDTQKELVEIKIDSEEDFNRIASQIDSPIFECSDPEETFAIDAQRKFKYSLKK